MPNLEGPLTTVALCWSLERSDGAGVAVTTYDQPIVKDDVRYEPAPGMVPAAVSRALGLEPHSAEVEGALSFSSLTAEDLALGRWDNAHAALLAVGWEDPDDEGLQLIQGQLGNVAVSGDAFSAELLGAATKLEAAVCPSTSAGCRAEFGDRQCRVDLAGRSVVAEVVGSNGCELTLDRELDDRFFLGSLRYLSGANAGVTTVVAALSGAAVSTRDLPRGAVEPGCRVELREGCDKQFRTCIERFSNALNFRGEPHLPGADRLTRYPGV